MEFQSIREIETAASISRKELFRMGSALLFMVGVMLFTSMRDESMPGSVMLIIAAMIYFMIRGMLLP